MAVAENTGGSQLAVISTEHTLATITAAGVYVFAVDLNPMAAGDVVELRVYGKCRAASTERVVFSSVYGPLQPAEQIAYSVPVVSPHHFKVTLKQTAGTGRTFTWAVYNT